jgi:hypothetical protein
MDGWMDGWTDGRMDGWMDGYSVRIADMLRCIFCVAMYGFIIFFILSIMGTER